jgi:histidinol dehydrogenase
MLEVRPYSNRDRRFREWLACGRKTDPLPDPETMELVKDIRDGGIDALIRHIRHRESEQVDAGNIRVGEAEILGARDAVSEQFLTALSLARVNIRKFHEYQRRRGYLHDDGDGVGMSRRVIPLERVGICCRSFTELLMYAVPAQVAGVRHIAVAAPPRPDGSLCPRLLTTAKILGIEEIHRMGGAQAVAALAYGTGPVERVDKIVGPGGDQATAAKRLLFSIVGVDTPVGLAELVVVADDSANAKFIASDLLAQAEHEDSAALIALFTTDRLLAEAVRIELDRLSEKLPRADALRHAVESAGGLYVFRSLDEAVMAVNALAPARVELCTRDNEEWLAEVETAGAVLMGHWTSEAAADYFAGMNPLLPLGGGARFASGIGVDDFVREMAVVEYGPARLLITGRHLTTLARDDGRPAHAAAIEERLELLKLATE